MRTSEADERSRVSNDSRWFLMCGVVNLVTGGVRGFPQRSSVTSTRLVTLFPCDSRALWHTCRRFALRGPLAATQIHAPRTAHKRSAAGLSPVRKWSSPGGDGPASQAVRFLSWNFLTGLCAFVPIGDVRAAVQVEKTMRNVQGIIPCDECHYTRSSAQFPHHS